MKTERKISTQTRFLVRQNANVLHASSNFQSEHIRSISDPEHPLSLEQLAVVSAPQVQVNGNNVLVEFTPTVPHCGASTLIGVHFLRYSH